MFTMFSGRFNLTLQVVDQVKKYFGTKVYKTTIPRTIRISEAPSYSVTFDIIRMLIYGKAKTKNAETT